MVRNQQADLPRKLRSYTFRHRGLRVTALGTIPASNLFVGQKTGETIPDVLCGWRDW